MTQAFKYLLPALLATAAPAAAQEMPIAPGDYVEMTGIEILPGGTMPYAQYLAGEWRKNQEFAKSRGWIKNYTMYENVNKRQGEPDIYLVTTFASMPDAAEDLRRDQAFEAWSKKSQTQAMTESGNRAQYRLVKSRMLLREGRFR